MKSDALSYQDEGVTFLLSRFWYSRSQKGRFSLTSPFDFQALSSRYQEVQNFINHIYSTSGYDLAKEVFAGKYGNGETRKAVPANPHKYSKKPGTSIPTDPRIKRGAYRIRTDGLHNANVARSQLR